MPRTRTRFGLFLAGWLIVASFRNAPGETPSLKFAGDSESLAATDAKFRFGTDVGGRFFDADRAPYESANPEHTAEKEFEAAMAKLISVTFDHPGTEAAARARCVLNAAEKALKQESEVKKNEQQFFSFGGVTVHR